MVILAAGDGSVAAATAVIVAAGALIGAVITGVLTYLANRRKTSSDRELGIIHASQDALVLRIDEQRKEIIDLRGQITAMRVELAEALERHAECERLRVEQSRTIASLRAKSGGD